MPQVKTEKINLRQLETGLHGEFIIKYRFNPKNDYHHSKPQFEADWPPEIAAALNETFARGDTFDEVRKNFFAGIEKFKTFETTKTRVILYHFGTSTPHNSSQIYLSVSAGVFDEQMTKSAAGATHYDYIKVEGGFNFGDQSGGGKWGGSRIEQFLPYNERNEKFFLYIKENMENLIAMMESIRYPEKLGEFIDAGRFLPVGKTEVKE
ncbi:MAG: hypothetical protein PHE15_05630 [Dehalococcoidales bacterium]|nr:hypothetical protein [Dehalococcoidales bacterium]